MTSTDKPLTQTEMDAVLNPNDLSGNQIKAMKALDDKNIDELEMEAALRQALVAYESAKNG